MECPSRTTRRARSSSRKPKMHQCLTCKKWFPRPSGLATHMNVHSGAKRELMNLVRVSRVAEGYAARLNAQGFGRHYSGGAPNLRSRRCLLALARKSPASPRPQIQIRKTSSHRCRLVHSAAAPVPGRTAGQARCRTGISRTAASRLSRRLTASPASTIPLLPCWLRGKRAVHTTNHGDVFPSTSASPLAPGGLYIVNATKAAR